MCGSISEEDWGLGRKSFGVSFHIFHNFILNFFVAFLFEGTKLKIVTVFSVRG